MDLSYTYVLVFFAVLASFLLGRKTAYLKLTIGPIKDEKPEETQETDPVKVAEPISNPERVLFQVTDCNHDHMCDVVEITNLHYNLEFDCGDQDGLTVWARKDSIYIKELIADEDETSDEILDEQLFDN